MQLYAYLFFNGNCEEAMNFYKDAFGGEIKAISRYNEAPMPFAEEDANKVMHGEMDVIGTKILFSDCPADRAANFGNNISLSLGFNNDAEITAAFNAISAGGTITMPLQDTLWGAKFGMCTDKFGVNWMFNWDKPKE